MSLKENNQSYAGVKYLAEAVPMTPRILWVVMLLFLNSCTQKSFNTKNDLWSYLRDENEGYLQHKTVNGYNFQVLYKPTDLVVEQELGEEKNKKSVKKMREKHQKYMYFLLSISSNNKELLSITPKNKQEFGALVHQLAFGMREKIHLYTTKKDTLKMLAYNYPRMYGMSTATSMLFVYPRDDKYLNEKELVFTIQDLGTNTGEVKFKIAVSKIKKEPQLKFN